MRAPQSGLFHTEGATALHANPVAGNRMNDFRVENAFFHANAFLQGIRSIVVKNCNGPLPQDRPRIHALINKVNCASAHFHTVFPSLLPSAKTGE